MKKISLGFSHYVVDSLFFSTFASKASINIFHPSVSLSSATVIPSSSSLDSDS